MFRGILKIRQSIIAYIGIILLGLICMSITGPVLSDALKYWGINQSIEENRALGDKLTQYGRRRDDVDAYIKELEQKRQELADSNAIVAWCWSNNSTDFARGVRNYILVGIFCIFIMGGVMCVYSVWRIGNLLKAKITNKNATLRAVSEDNHVSPSDEFIEEMRRIRSEGSITEEQLADADRLISALEYDLI